MSNYDVLKEYYIRYLRIVRDASESTVKKYLGALTTISKYLVEHNVIQDSIYEIWSLNELVSVREFLYTRPDFVEKDERGNRMYSAGLNNYVRFASGEEFEKIEKCKIDSIDFTVPIGVKVDISSEKWSRKGILKQQSLEMAKYTCETDISHKTFISSSTGHQYMEGHHAIPMCSQDKFKVSLDVYANIVCLCPVCHRMLHYGVNEDKRIILSKIYHDRATRLANSGIKVSQEEFIILANAN